MPFVIQIKPQSIIESLFGLINAHQKLRVVGLSLDMLKQ